LFAGVAPMRGPALKGVSLRAALVEDVYDAEISVVVLCA
jgi:hypothetical protein